MSPVFFKSHAGLSSGCVFLNLADVLARTLWSLDSLLSPGLTCSKANEIKKVVMIERATWDAEPQPRGRQNYIWLVGVSPSADEQALLLCRKSRWTRGDPVFCVAERTWNFPSLGLIGLDPTALFLSWDRLQYHDGSQTYTAVDSEVLRRSAEQKRCDIGKWGQRWTQDKYIFSLA